MLKNKKGLSAIVMTIIMIGLVLVAVGIVWTVISNLLGEQTESLDYNGKCLGIDLEIKNLNCNTENCTFVVERSFVSKGDPIDGLAVIFSSDSESSPEEIILQGNIPAVITKNNIKHGISTNVTRVDARIYFNKGEGEKHFCSQKISGINTA